jgi:inosose dehydratase
VSLLEAPVGCVPIVWNNADMPDLAPEVAADTVLDEIARLGFEGTTHGRGFPEGEVLRATLAQRALRFAELYSALGATEAGLAKGAADIARRDLGRLIAAGGEVLVLAVNGGETRDEWAGRVPDGAPRWNDEAFDELAQLLAELAAGVPDGAQVAFHPHAGTWIEDPQEVEALAERLPGTGAGLCLDVAHYLVGGGDPVAAVERYRELIVHIHAKDVDPAVLTRLRDGEPGTLTAAIRERIFTQLGNGALDLDAMLRALDRIGYGGWLMVEQDTSWLPPSEAAAIGKSVLEYARRTAMRELVA